MDSVAKFEIRDKFETLYVAFRLGFESVFRIDVKHYIIMMISYSPNGFVLMSYPYLP